jgi:hypothetical protein
MVGHHAYRMNLDLTGPLKVHPAIQYYSHQLCLSEKSRPILPSIEMSFRFSLELVVDLRNQFSPKIRGDVNG